MTRIHSAADYVHQTRYNRQNLSGGGLDWSNQPTLYKTYSRVEAVPLPRQLTLPRVPALTVLQGKTVRSPQALNLTRLAEILFMGYGFTHQVEYGSETFLYRSAPSAGALYPSEIYLAARDLDDLPDGLYHYSLTDFSLVRLRSGPLPGDMPGPALILTNIFFRSAWKYKDRAFRYCLLDMGHLAENLMLALSATGIGAELVTDFDDDRPNTYLGVDPHREAAMALILLGTNSAVHRDAGGVVPDDPPQAEPEAKHPDLPPIIPRIADLTAERLAGGSGRDLTWPDLKEVDLPNIGNRTEDAPTLVQAMQNRRSRRNFRARTSSPDDLAEILAASLIADAGRMVNVGCVISEIDGLSDGYYVFNSLSGRIGLHKGGFLTPALSGAALGQEWFSRAAVTLVFTAPLARLEQELGPRALRLAFLTAGRIGQRAYLAAEALGWGACGVGAFF